MWPIREIRSRDSGEGTHKRALRGRTQMRTGRSLARADRDRDYEAVRFERHAPGTASCAKTLALDMIEALNSNLRKPYV